MLTCRAGEVLAVVVINAGSYRRVLNFSTGAAGIKDFFLMSTSKLSNCWESAEKRDFRLIPTSSKKQINRKLIEIKSENYLNSVESHQFPYFSSLID